MQYVFSLSSSKNFLIFQSLFDQIVLVASKSLKLSEFSLKFAKVLVEHQNISTNFVEIFVFSALKRKPIDNIGTIAPSNKKEVRDPRFDALCGEYDEKIFKTSYKFVDGIKAKELIELKKQLKDEQSNEQDEEKIEQLKYLIQRMENQVREKTKINKQKEAEKEEKNRNRELAKEGKAPVFMSKAERKNKELVDKFEELKSSGRIDSYLKKKAKKNETKDRIKMRKMKSQIK